jgi:hypothetical protein
VAAGPQVWTEDVIAEKFAQGRGQGTRENYMPWIRIQEFGSIAPQTRIPCLLFPRSIHTFSYTERAMYLYLEFQGGLERPRLCVSATPATPKGAFPW